LWRNTAGGQRANDSETVAGFFEIDGYDWLTDTHLLFRNTCLKAQIYLWKYPGGANFATSSAAAPTNIAYTVPGYKTVKLITITKEGCTDSASKVIEIIGAAAVDVLCSSSGQGNVVDSLKGKQYFVNRALYEDEYGDRIVAGGYTDMTNPNDFSPKGL
jgi:PKD repeat protein